MIKALCDACELAIKQRIPGKQLVFLTDATFTSTGYSLMTEDNPDQKTSQRGTLMRVWRSDEKSSPPQNTKCPYTREKFWQFTWHFWSQHTGCGKHQNQQLL